MNLNNTVPTLVDEACALRAELDDVLLRIASQSDEADMITSIFLAAHAVNGSAGVFILDQVVFFSRAAKDVQDSSHRENLRISAELEASLCGVLDQLDRLIDVLMLCDLAYCIDRIDDFIQIAQRLLGTARYQKLYSTRSLASTVQDALAQLERLIAVRTFCEPAVYFCAPAHRAVPAH
jgi:chemotaxis protein histidine kinase CheA